MDFNHNGIGVLSDCISCQVTEELNGKYELTMKYPQSGIWFPEIKLRSILVAKPNKSDDPQPFRIYRITKPIKGIVTIYAEHISYDLSGYPISPFWADRLQDALVGIKNNSLIENPFVFYSDKSDVGDIDFTLPRSIRSAIGGDEPSILSAYGGELHFDKFNVNILSRRGQETGVQIRYGKNLIDLKQEENINSTYTGIYPYYTDSNGGVYSLPEKVLHAEGDFGFVKIQTVDLTEFLGDVEYITEDDFREVAIWYLDTHNFGKPVVSINVSFIDLSDTEEYKDYKSLSSVNLGDTIEVIFEKIGISSKARIAKTVFDVLTERYDSVVVGEIQKTISDSVATAPTKEYIKQEDATNRQKLESVIRDATELLNGANGGVFEILDENHDGINDAWIIKSYDELEYIKATRSGIGLTEDGGKSYRTAMTAKGINADVINTGFLNADRIESNSIGSEKIQAESITAEKIASGAITTEKIDANAVTAKEIASGAVTTEKISAGAITANEIASNAITSEKIQAGAITSTEIASGTITSENIKSGTITSKEIASNTITGDNLKAGTVTADKMNADGIVAKDVDVTGKVTASEGFIGEFSIENEGITKTTTTTETSDNDVITISTDRVTILPNYIEAYKYIISGVQGSGGAIPVVNKSVSLKDGAIYIDNFSINDIFGGKNTIMFLDLADGKYEVYLDTSNLSLKVREVT